MVEPFHSKQALTPAQAQAIQYVRVSASLKRQHACERIERHLKRAGIPSVTLRDILAALRASARVTVNFHPDRLLADGSLVAEGLLRDGVYRSQFETGVTSASPTAYPGGDRDRWERRLFGGAYHQAGITHRERPKYGALNLMQHPDGGAPNFGSCHLVLHSAMLARCTYTFGDSYSEPEHSGTIDVFDPLLAALLDEAAAPGSTPGRDAGGSAALIRRLLASGEESPSALRRELDQYIEAQIHGDIAMVSDVEAIVADPSFQGTPIGEQIAVLASRYGVALRWHHGFQLAASAVPDDFQGPKMPPLARRVARDFAAVPGQLDAYAIGQAARSLARHPELWADWGTPRETWQLLKQLWHVLVRFGHPYRGHGRS
ncbi:hypothetical protein J27TS7_51670 [Paenibacillus dendritiformis]|uniref:DUF3626 domain-containing protein n=1 Tax=Paenibacillus dendritiformis TaxID=130049 RepID=UPI00143D2016|nr:DUF3626 domain-containing protein [Paenibacillus dendritiformis]NKI20188.1 DUF3626 domain-containing protein [Paenibacillus dendritiformis]NRF99622.1 DUF3626 domain-containing protein [Paenibacillus dendritiformis]GIO75653.1 hypothetical protein J27TS7_51670 [Paenibacillus dendritiformis]